ncbi:MAG: HEAT repeat domain-containing protein [Deltaproteobacteria bacterium]|nr:HEAT repeat domain-containing protein [Deltaproteobacteria bacterium]
MDATAHSGGNKQPRTLAGLTFVRALRPLLYVLLVGSAILAFWGGGEIAGQKLPRWAASFGPALFGVFLVAFSIYRLALVRAKRYPAANGLFQIGLGVLVFVLLLPGSRHGLEAIAPATGPDDVTALLSSADPRVRSLAAEVIGLRGASSRYAPALIDHLTDEDAHVRQEVKTALIRIAGYDAAQGVPDDQVVQKWRDEAKQRGWTAP